MINALRNVLPVMFAVASVAASAAPMGYSVNSDAPDGDTLHTIDMATGEEVHYRVTNARVGLGLMYLAGAVSGLFTLAFLLVRVMRKAK